MITNVRLRTEGELVVLQVFENFPRTAYRIQDTDWRDAKVTDLLEVSAHFNTAMGDRIKALEDLVDNITDRVWGDE